MKLRLQDVPPALMIGAARALSEDEALGRAPYDWRGQKTSIMRHVGGILRHLSAFLDGEDVDPDSSTGKHHLEGVAGRLAILLDAIALGDVTDDRPTKGAAPTLIRSGQTVPPPKGPATSVSPAGPDVVPAYLDQATERLWCALHRAPRAECPCRGRLSE